jgi:hypothetical protein
MVPTEVCVFVGTVKSFMCIVTEVDTTLTSTVDFVGGGVVGARATGDLVGLSSFCMSVSSA